ncbi:hypothetical protein Ancab_033374 [Ancistrocladus abbreviatus]
MGGDQCMGRGGGLGNEGVPAIGGVGGRGEVGGRRCGCGKCRGEGRGEDYGDGMAPTQQDVQQGNLAALDMGHQEEAHTRSLGGLATQKQAYQESLEALVNNDFSPQTKDGSPKLELRGKLGPSLQPSSVPDERPSRAAETNRECEADQQGTMERGRNTRVKSMAEISCPKLVIGRSGRRSKRVPRQLLTTGEK